MDSVLFDFLSDYMTLSASEKAVLTELSVIRAFKKGTVLLREGEYTDKGYFVLKGSLRTYFILDGEEKTSGLILSACWLYSVRWPVWPVMPVYVE